MPSAARRKGRSRARKPSSRASRRRSRRQSPRRPEKQRSRQVRHANRTHGSRACCIGSARRHRSRWKRLEPLSQRVHLSGRAKVGLPAAARRGRVPKGGAKARPDVTSAVPNARRVPSARLKIPGVPSRKARSKAVVPRGGRASVARADATDAKARGSRPAPRAKVHGPGGKVADRKDAKARVSRPVKVGVPSPAKAGGRRRARARAATRGKARRKTCATSSARNRCSQQNRPPWRRECQQRKLLQSAGERRSIAKAAVDDAADVEVAAANDPNAENVHRVKARRERFRRPKQEADPHPRNLQSQRLRLPRTPRNRK